MRKESIMEALWVMFTYFALLVVGVLFRAALVILALALLALPFLGFFTAMQAVGNLWRRLTGRVSVDGLVWNPALFYAPAHTWIARKGPALIVGLDDLAQRILAGAQRIELPRLGEEVREGQAATVVICGDKRTEIASPVDGIVASANDALRDDPEVIHTDPYRQAWLYSVLPRNSRYRELPRGKSARVWFEAEVHRFTRFLEDNLGIAAADGGELLLPAPSLLSEEQWAALTAKFLTFRRDEAGDAPSRSVNGRTRIHGVPRPLVPFAAVGGAIAGGLYIVLLPVIGFALLLGCCAVWICRGLRYSARCAAELFSQDVR